MLKPIWNYGLQVLRCATTLRLKFIRSFQAIIGGPWYDTNQMLFNILTPFQIFTISEEIRRT